MNQIAEQQHLLSLPGDILLILALSGLIIPALQHARMSPVLGYLFCGLMIGPNALGLLTQDYPWLSGFVITDEGLIKFLAELGVVFLLFMIGLELTFSRLWDLRRYVLGLGSMQILVTACVIFIIALQFGNSIPASILLGSVFALSSTAIIMQLMQERHMISRPIGRICFSVLLMQDLAVVPILVAVSVFSGESDVSVGVLLLESLVLAGVVIVSIFIIGKLLLRPLLRVLSPAKNPEWLLAMTLFLVTGAATLTDMAGLSAALGAFLAGLLIAETEYRHEIEAITEPVKGILMGIFFLSVGMATDVTAFLERPFWLLASVVGVFLIKAGIIYPLARLFSVPKSQAAQAAVLLAQGSEFAFVVIGLALAGGMLPYEDAQFFLLVVTASLLVTPFTTKLVPFAQYLVGKDQKKDITEVPETAKEGQHVIIAGFGRAGRTLADILEKQMVPYVAVDQNGLHVAHMRARGYPVIYGNVRNVDLWRKLNIDNALAAVIIIDEYTATEPVLTSLRQHWPLLPILVRIKDTNDTNKYYGLGANVVIPEKLESTLRIVFNLLEYSGIDKEEVREIVRQHRQELTIKEQ